MIPLYLNSLYNFLFENNPLMLMGKDFYKNLKALWHLRRNLTQVDQKYRKLLYRAQVVEAYVNANQVYPHTRFDVYR